MKRKGITNKNCSISKYISMSFIGIRIKKNNLVRIKQMRDDCILHRKSRMDLKEQESDARYLYPLHLEIASLN